MKCTSIRLRPFNVGGGFEIILPNGKVVLTDPFFPADQFPGGQTREDVTGADYILPLAFDPAVCPAVAQAVAQAARDTGVARI